MLLLSLRVQCQQTLTPPFPPRWSIVSFSLCIPRNFELHTDQQISNFCDEIRKSVLHHNQWGVFTVPFHTISFGKSINMIIISILSLKIITQFESLVFGYLDKYFLKLNLKNGRKFQIFLTKPFLTDNKLVRSKFCPSTGSNQFKLVSLILKSICQAYILLFRYETVTFRLKVSDISDTRNKSHGSIRTFEAIFVVYKRNKKGNCLGNESAVNCNE